VKEVRGVVREGVSEVLRPQGNVRVELLFLRAEGLSFYVNYVQGNSTKPGINSTYV
jgi:NADPH-dependent glutamate synthase beta subunit-like oxidoreductase